jgi:YidC/Oxa1 family membrane protein insertase
MRDLQPQIAEIQARNKDDKQKQSQELMAFYKDKKINPIGSCLPLLIQLPFLLILYYVFIHGLDMQRFDLLYRLTPRPDFINTYFLGLDLAKPDRYFLPIIAGIFQFIQARQMMPPTSNTQARGADMQNMISKQMMYLMPIFTVIIAMRLPAALPLYWIITTLFAIGQQWWVFRQNGESLKLKTQSLKVIGKTPDKIIKHGVELTVRRKK